MYIPPQIALNCKPAPDPPAALDKPGMIRQSRTEVPFPIAVYPQQDAVMKEYLVVEAKPPLILKSGWAME